MSSRESIDQRLVTDSGVGFRADSMGNLSLGGGNDSYDPYNSAVVPSRYQETHSQEVKIPLANVRAQEADLISAEKRYQEKIEGYNKYRQHIEDSRKETEKQIVDLKRDKNYGWDPLKHLAAKCFTDYDNAIDAQIEAHQKLLDGQNKLLKKYDQNWLSIPNIDKQINELTSTYQQLKDKDPNGASTVYYQIGALYNERQEKLRERFNDFVLSVSSGKSKDQSNANGGSLDERGPGILDKFIDDNRKAQAIQSKVDGQFDTAISTAQQVRNFSLLTSGALLTGGMGFGAGGTVAASGWLVGGAKAVAAGTALASGESAIFNGIEQGALYSKGYKSGDEALNDYKWNVLRETKSSLLTNSSILLQCGLTSGFASLVGGEALTSASLGARATRGAALVGSGVVAQGARSMADAHAVEYIDQNLRDRDRVKEINNKIKEFTDKNNGKEPTREQRDDICQEAELKYYRRLSGVPEVYAPLEELKNQKISQINNDRMMQGQYVLSQKEEKSERRKIEIKYCVDQIRECHDELKKNVWIDSATGGVGAYFGGLQRVGINALSSKGYANELAYRVRAAGIYAATTVADLSTSLGIEVGVRKSRGEALSAGQIIYRAKMGLISQIAGDAAARSMVKLPTGKENQGKILAPQGPGPKPDEPTDGSTSANSTVVATPPQMGTKPVASSSNVAQDGAFENVGSSRQDVLQQGYQYNKATKRLRQIVGWFVEKLDKPTATIKIATNPTDPKPFRESRRIFDENVKLQVRWKNEISQLETSKTRLEGELGRLDSSNPDYKTLTSDIKTLGDKIKSIKRDVEVLNATNTHNYGKKKYENAINKEPRDLKSECNPYDEIQAKIKNNTDHSKWYGFLRRPSNLVQSLINSPTIRQDVKMSLQEDINFEKGILKDVLGIDYDSVKQKPSIKNSKLPYEFNGNALVPKAGAENYELSGENITNTLMMLSNVEHVVKNYSSHNDIISSINAVPPIDGISGKIYPYKCEIDSNGNIALRVNNNFFELLKIKPNSSADVNRMRNDIQALVSAYSIKERESRLPGYSSRIEQLNNRFNRVNSLIQGGKHSQAINELCYRYNELYIADKVLNNEKQATKLVFGYGTEKEMKVLEGSSMGVRTAKILPSFGDDATDESFLRSVPLFRKIDNALTLTSFPKFVRTAMYSGGSVFGIGLPMFDVVTGQVGIWTCAAIGTYSAFKLWMGHPGAVRAKSVSTSSAQSVKVMVDRITETANRAIDSAAANRNRGADVEGSYQVAVLTDADRKRDVAIATPEGLLKKNDFIKSLEAKKIGESDRLYNEKIADLSKQILNPKAYGLDKARVIALKRELAVLRKEGPVSYRDWQEKIEGQRLSIEAIDVVIGKAKPKAKNKGNAVVIQNGINKQLQESVNIANRWNAVLPPVQSGQNGGNN